MWIGFNDLSSQYPELFIAVVTGQDKGIRQYADAPAERVSLKAKLEVMKAKVAGAEKLGKQMDKGKEVTI